MGSSLRPLKNATSFGVPSGPALGAGAVVAVDVDDQRVVEPAQVLEGLDHAADLVVVVGGIGGEDFNLPDEELLRLRAELVPRLQEVIGPRRQLRIPGDHAEALLVLKDALAQLVVAIVEEVHGTDLVHPLLGRVMRRVRGAGRVLDEDRLAGVGLVDARDVVDGVVRHAGDKVPARLALEGIDLGGVAEQIRLPLVGIAAHKAVEILEAQACGPLVEGPDLAGGKRRGVVVLAEPRRGIAVIEQNPPDGGLVLGDDAVVARETRGLLGDHAEARRVMVPPGDERGPRRRTQRGGEYAVVAQTLVCDAVHGRRRDDAAEGAGHPEAGIVGDDQQHVRCALRRHHARRPPGLRFQGVILDHATELRVGRGQLLAAYRGGGAGRTQLSGNFLRPGRQGCKCNRDQNRGDRHCY